MFTLRPEIRFFKNKQGELAFCARIFMKGFRFMVQESNLDRQKAVQTFEWQQFQNAMLTNLEAMSRTSKGVSDTSSSADKPKLSTEGEGLAQKTVENFNKAIGFVWEHRQDSFATEAEVKEFVEALSEQVSEGLLKDNQGLWRTWETNYESTRPEKIQEDLGVFYQELSKRVSQHEDPVATAGWAEQRFDGYIHPLADGCGRTSKLISAMVLARQNSKLPNYRNRDEYYQNIKKPFPEWEKYYRSLFSEN